MLRVAPGIILVSLQISEALRPAYGVPTPATAPAGDRTRRPAPAGPHFRHFPGHHAARRWVAPAAVAALLGRTLTEHLRTCVTLTPQGATTAAAALGPVLAAAQ